MNINKKQKVIAVARSQKERLNFEPFAPQAYKNVKRTNILKVKECNAKIKLWNDSSRGLKIVHRIFQTPTDNHF